MKFQITYKATGEVAKFRANQWRDFEAEAWDIFTWVLHHPTTEVDYEFMVEGKVINMDLAQKAATYARKEWEAKRATTHKQITKRKQGTQGNFKNNFETVWVKIW
jgi:hypothetical protein